MKVYAIFSGGGVKGAALAGCLQVIQERHDIEIAGYGGCSSGSIVALLGAIGYKGKDIHELMKTSLHPQNMLADKGKRLDLVKKMYSRVRDVMKSKKWVILKAWQLKSILSEFEVVVETMLNQVGLYDGELLKEYLMARIKEKLPALAEAAAISFEDLEIAGSPPLKVIASDIANNKAAVFSKDAKNFGTSVVDAICASTSYPLMFQTVLMPGGYRLADGGLSSNLPVFLFSKEQVRTRFPILAFDLVTPAEERDKDYKLNHLFSDLLNTALEASDEIMQRHPLIHPIPVKIPKGIHALKFDLTSEEIDELYNSGYSAASAFCHQWRKLKTVSQAGEILQLQLQSQYGDSKLFALPLMAICTAIEDYTQAEEVRAHIMLPTGRPDGSRIVVYHYGFNIDPDADLELSQYGGCSGKALEQRKPVYADLELTKKNYTKWGMTPNQQGKVDPNRKSMVSVPIFLWTREHDRVEDMDIIGILSIDSVTELAQGGWVENSRLDPDVYGIMAHWADVFGKLLS